MSAKPLTNNGTMTFRCPSDLQAAFVAACQAQDISTAQVLRAAMRDFVDSRESATEKGKKNG